MKRTIRFCGTAVVLTWAWAWALGAGSLQAYTYPGAVRSGGSLGQAVAGSGAKSVGMGSSGVTGTGEALTGFLNPAGLGLLEKPEFQFTAGVVPNSERIVSTITGQVRQAFFNGRTYFQLNGGAMAWPFLLGPRKDKTVTLMIGGRPEQVTTYQNDVARLDTNGVKTGSRRVSGAGQVFGLGAGVAVKPQKHVSLGVAFDLWTHPSQSITIRDVTDATSDSPLVATTTVISSKLKNGYTVTFGVIGRLTDHFRVGIAFQPGRNVRADRTDTTTVSTGTADISQTVVASSVTTWIPSVLMFGFSVHMPDFANSSAHFDFLFSNADKVRVNGATPAGLSIRDTWEIRIGAEHYLSDDLALRYGYRFEPWFGNREVNAAFFSAGLGYRVSERVGLDVAGEFGKRNYRFLDPNERFFTTDQRVDESTRRVLFQIRTFF